MDFAQWKSIGERYLRYDDLLRKRLSRWPEESIAEATTAEELREMMSLRKRLERHLERMERHSARALMFSPTAGGRQ